MKRKREEEKSNASNSNGNGSSNNNMEIVWQTPANPPVKHDYVFRDGKIKFELK